MFSVGTLRDPGALVRKTNVLRTTKSLCCLSNSNKHAQSRRNLKLRDRIESDPLPASLHP